MKTPAEIKKALDCCNQFRSGGHWNICSKCPCDIGIGRCDGTLETDALAYIQQLESQIPRWIPVEERLPDKMKIVLVFKRRTAHFIWSDAMWNIETDWCGEDGWSKNPHNGCFAVTHWMPLPEPPIKEDKK